MSRSFRCQPNTLESPRRDHSLMAPLTPAQRRWFEKRRELEAFEKVLQQAEQMVEFYTGLGDKFDVLGDGSQGTLLLWDCLMH